MNRPSPGAATVSAFRSNLAAVGVMLVAVALQVTGAVLLKSIADHRGDWGLLLLALGVGGVGVVNIARLVVWGVAHRNFPLSTTFPLSALFFPAMLIVAAGFGDTVGGSQITGGLLIALGTFWLTARVRG